MTYTVFEASSKSHLEKKIFFDGTPGIARYETSKYSWLNKLLEKQLSFFWIPEEVNLQQDSNDFKSLTRHEQHIFLSNLKRQILLDTVQGRSPSLAFLPIVSIPEMEIWVQAWSFSETIHSKSYTHIIRNVFSNPSEVFDEIMNIQEIMDCSEDISKDYNQLILYNNARGAAEWNGWDSAANEYDHKKSLWLTINSINILEGIRFYASFACSWAFAENKKMEGNAKIIKLICRDENLHLAGTQQLLKTLPQDDPDFAKIKEETKAECEKMFLSALEQEKKWAEYLFKDGSMVGLNKQLLVDYLDHIAYKRMTALGLDCPVGSPTNPLPWTQKWIAGSEVQVAPQEVELSSYTVGAIKQDVSVDSFKGMKL
jgi:ribonucleoside-diphosphate reductase beta chain